MNCDSPKRSQKRAAAKSCGDCSRRSQAAQKSPATPLHWRILVCWPNWQNRKSRGNDEIRMTKRDARESREFTRKKVPEGKIIRIDLRYSRSRPVSLSCSCAFVFIRGLSLRKFLFSAPHSYSVKL